MKTGITGWMWGTCFKMADSFARQYPHIDKWGFAYGWIELGSDDYSASFIRALDTGGMVWEGQPFYDSMEEALADLERGLAAWMQENRME